MTGKEFLESKQVKNIILGISNQIGVVDLATLLELYYTQQLAIDGVIERFSINQKVKWGKKEYFVIEDNLQQKVLVANHIDKQHPMYNDWWVDRFNVNAL